MAINSIGTSSYYAPAVSEMWNRSPVQSDASGQTVTKTTPPTPPPSMFSGVDIDQSGGLDQSEFETMLSQISENSDDSVDAEQLFASYDSDADGILSETEVTSFLDANKPAPPPPPGPDLTDIYADADEDGNGTIDSEETQTLVDMINNATGQELSTDDLLTAYDEDGDGVLNQDETITALEDNQPDMAAALTSTEIVSQLFDIFQATDADSDGTISVEEAETLVTMINNAITEGLTVENLIQAFDNDADGSLSGVETVTALAGDTLAKIPDPQQLKAGVSHYLNMKDLLDNAASNTVNAEG